MKRFLQGPCLFAIGLIAAFYASVPANAHTIGSKVRKWTPTPASIDMTSGHIVKPFCDGKYEYVASDLHDFSLPDSIHFYRFNSGLPKLGVRSHGLSYGRHTRRETRLRDALLLMDRSQSHLSPEAVGDYIMTLNVNVHSGKDPDWWINAKLGEATDKKQGCTIWLDNDWNGTSCLKYYRQDQSASAKVAKENTAFDWLMTGHQLENVRTNWLGYAKLNENAVSNIFQHIDKQSLERPGINIWMAQYQHHKIIEHEIPADITRRAQDAILRIISCEANPREYGIIAVGDLGLPREYLPKGLAESRARRDIHRLTYKAITSGDGLNAAYHEELRSLVDQLEEKSWATSFLFLSAPDIASAIDLYQDSLSQEENQPTRFYRGYYGYSSTGIKGLIFGLPTESIPHTLMKFGHALSENNLSLVASLEEETFSTALFIQRGKLADLQKHLEQIQQYKKSDPQIESAQRILNSEKAKITQLEALKKSDLPIQVRATLLAILAEVSHNDDKHNRRHPKNIYPEQSGSEFLDVYLRHKLFPGISFSPRVRGYPPHKHPRLYLAGSSYSSEVHALPSLRKNDGTPEVGLAALIDWQKLDAFSKDQKLTRTLAVNIIEWMDRASPEDRRANSDVIAPALYAIIRMARFEDAGTYKEAPVQKHIYEYLQKYYGHTTYAENTTHWWLSSPRGHVPF